MKLSHPYSRSLICHSYLRRIIPYIRNRMCISVLSSSMDDSTYWSPERVKDWVTSFAHAHGYPPAKIDMDNGGLSKQHRIAYGGVTGILMLAGLTAASYSIQRKSRDKEREQWLNEHNPHLKDDQTIKSRSRVQPPPFTISDDYVFSPSECVRYGRFALHKKNNSTFLSVIERHSKSSRSPTISNYIRYYDDIDALVRRRIRWESWHKLNYRERQKLALGYSCLALARVDGDLEYFKQEIETLHRLDLGPSFQKTMKYTYNREHNSAPLMSVLARTIIDSCVQNPHSLYDRTDIDPVFIPEIIEALIPLTGFDELSPSRTSQDLDESI